MYKTVVKNKPNNHELPLLAAVFTSLLCTVFGANAVAIKISLTGLGTFTTAGLRFAMATFAICLWAKLTGRSFRINKEQLPQLLILSLIFTIQLSLMYIGFSKTNASRATLLINLQPFFVLFLAHLFIPGDRITHRKILGLFLGFTGMAFVFLAKKGITDDAQTGDVLILVTALVWACNTVYTKRIINDFEPFQVVFYPMMFSAPCFLIAGFIWDEPMIGHLNPEVVGALLYQGLLTAAFAFVAWNYLLQKYGAVSLHSFIFIMPIVGVLLGEWLLDEPVTYNILLALLLIVTGILVVNLKTGKTTGLFPQRGM